MNETAERPARRTGCGRMFACGCGVLLLLAIATGITLYVFRWKIGATVLRRFVTAGLDHSRLEPEERDGIRKAAERVFSRMEAGRMDMEGMRKLRDSFVENPISKALGAALFKGKYLWPSGLDPERKARADRDLDRFVRGVVEGKISQRDVEAIMAHFPQEKLKGTVPGLPEELPDATVGKIADEVHRVVEERGVPDESYRVDLVEEINRWIDGALGEEH